MSSPRIGRPRKIGEAELEVLRQHIASDPTATLGELCEVLWQRCGVRVHEQTLIKALRMGGIERVRPSADDSGEAQRQAVRPRRYGYQPAHRQHDPRHVFPSDLTDVEWALVRDLFERDGGRGAPARLDRRVLVNACCYVVRTGCAWRMLPPVFGPWQNVYRTFRRWSEQGKFERMHDRLRILWRQRLGRDAAPSAAVLDAQCTRSSPQGGDSGYDAGKKVKGRKRHLLVDTLGLLLAVSITAASVQDRDGAPAVLAQGLSKYPTLSKLFVDSAYAGQCAQALSQQYGVSVQVVRHPHNRNVGRWVDVQRDLFEIAPAAARGFVVQAKRWVVERTHAWNERSRRLIMHHDRLSAISAAWVWLAEARLLLRRVAG